MKWHKFLYLERRDKILFVRIAALLLLARLGLLILPYRTILKLARRKPGSLNARRPVAVETYVGRVKRLTTTAGKYLLGARPCLPQALVVERLLRNAGLDATLEIGVTKDRDDQFVAHAWVESGGEIVIGGKLSPKRYSRLQPHSEDVS